jgi:hypothetical protein
VLSCGLLLLWSAPEARAQVANFQTDARDYEVLSYLPSGSVVPLGYFRQVSSSDSQSFSESEGIFRASSILKFGSLAIVPFDAILPVVDAIVYAPVPMMPGGTVTLHSSGVGDLTYLPTIAYIFREDDTTHTYLGATVYVTAPTATYDAAHPVNIGDNRWRIQPQLAVGQRFLKALTVDLVGSVATYTDNTNFGIGAGMPTVTQKQDITPAFEGHLAADLSTTFFLATSYYLAAVGRRTIVGQALPETTIDQQQTIQTLRFSFGVHVEKSSLLLLQYNQDIEASGGATISRFIGARFSHVFVL